ncbi:MAG: AAA family ATPase [Dermatophilaceae bacterium]
MSDGREEATAEKRVRSEVDRYKLAAQARAQASAELAAEGWKPPPNMGSLKEALARGVPDAEYTVEGLMPRGANVLLNAQWKKGKTTAALNLARSLTDETPVFGAYSTDLPSGTVAWWNAEMDDRTALRWLDDMAFTNTDRLFPLGLRGYSTPLSSGAVRDWAVDWLLSNNVKVWVLDPFGTLYDGEENSNSEVRDWLKAVDEIKRRASIDNVVLVAHTGHMGDDEAEVRARGAARLMDWADVIWSYRAGNNASPDRRYLSAYGRDVNLPEVALDFNASTRSLSLVAGAGSRTADRRASLAVKAADVVASHHATTGQPMNKTALEDALGRGRSDVKRAAISEAAAAGWVRIEDGPRKARLHYPGDESPHVVRIDRATP